MDNTRRTIHGRRRTMPGVWHKLPTGELKMTGRRNLEEINKTKLRISDYCKQEFHQQTVNSTKLSSLKCKHVQPWRVLRRRRRKSACAVVT